MRITIEIDTANVTDEDLTVLRAIGGPKAAGFFEDAGTVQAGTPTDLSEGRAKEVPCLHYADETGVCKRCGEQIEAGVRGATDEEREAETLTEEKPKRKRRTKAEMEAARAAEAETAPSETAMVVPDSEQAETVQEGAPEPEAVSEAPTAAEGDRTIDEWRKEAVTQATVAVAEGRRPAVVTALAAVGAKRVGELRDDQLAAFLGALKDA